MKDTSIDLIQKACRILEKTTPYPYDCGAVCGKRCCGGDHTMGMWLLPGEETILGESFSIRKAPDGQKIAVCGGRCLRKNRPFSCRIFPLFPRVSFDPDGRTHVRADWDPRAKTICPIAAGELRISFRFRFAVSRAGRLLLRDPSLKSWLLESQSFLDEITRLQKRLGG